MPRIGEGVLNSDLEQKPMKDVLLIYTRLLMLVQALHVAADRGEQQVVWSPGNCAKWRFSKLSGYLLGS